MLYHCVSSALRLDSVPIPWGGRSYFNCLLHCCEIRSVSEWRKHKPRLGWTNPIAHPSRYHVLYKVFQYRPRIEGVFTRIERWTSDTGKTHWRSTTRDNVTTLYGLDEESQISDRAEDSQMPIRVFSYLISRTFDDKGNIAVY